MVAKGAEPDARAEVDAAVRVEDGSAGLALDGIVGKRGRKTVCGKMFERGVHATERDDAAGGFQTRGRPGEPGPAHAVHFF